MKFLKKLTHTTNSMSTKQMTLSTADICSIIKACGDNGVQSFSYSGLDLSFKAKEETEKIVIDHPSLQGPVSELSEQNYSDPDDFPADKEDIREAKARSLMEASLEDPYEAEMYEAMDDQVKEHIEELERE